MKLDMRLVVWTVGLLAVVSVPDSVWSHQTDESEHHTEIRPETGEVEQLLSVSALDLAHHLGHIGHGEEPSLELLEEIRTDLGDYFEEQTGIRADDEMCEMREAEFVDFPAADGRVHRHQKWDCPAYPDEVEIANRLMLDGHEGYRHTGQIQVGDELYQTVFDRNYPTFAVYPESEPADEQQSDEERDHEEQSARSSVDDQPDDDQSDTETTSPLMIIGIVGLLLAGAMLVGWVMRRNR